MSDVHKALMPFLKSLESVTYPVEDAMGLSITNPLVVNRFSWGQPKQGVDFPRFQLDGPYDHDSGQVSRGLLTQKLSTWWLSCYGEDGDFVMDWLTSIEVEIGQLFNGTYYFTHESGRISNMILLPMSKCLITTPLTTGTTQPPAGGTIGYRVSWYPSP